MKCNSCDKEIVQAFYVIGGKVYCCDCVHKTEIYEVFDPKECQSRRYMREDVKFYTDGAKYMTDVWNRKYEKELEIKNIELRLSIYKMQLKIIEEEIKQNLS